MATLSPQMVMSIDCDKLLSMPSGRGVGGVHQLS